MSSSQNDALQLLNSLSNTNAPAAQNEDETQEVCIRYGADAKELMDYFQECAKQSPLVDCVLRNDIQGLRNQLIVKPKQDNSSTVQYDSNESNESTSYSDNLLMLAVFLQRAEIVNLLIDAGADITQHNQNNYCPFELALLLWDDNQSSVQLKSIRDKMLGQYAKALEQVKPKIKNWSNGDSKEAAETYHRIQHLPGDYLNFFRSEHSKRAYSILMSLLPVTPTDLCTRHLFHYKNCITIEEVTLLLQKGIPGFGEGWNILMTMIPHRDPECNLGEFIDNFPHLLLGDKQTSPLTLLSEYADKDRSELEDWLETYPECDGTYYEHTHLYKNMPTLLAKYDEYFKKPGFLSELHASFIKTHKQALENIRSVLQHYEAMKTKKLTASIDILDSIGNNDPAITHHKITEHYALEERYKTAFIANFNRGGQKVKTLEISSDQVIPLVESIPLRNTGIDTFVLSGPEFCRWDDISLKGLKRINKILNKNPKVKTLSCEFEESSYYEVEAINEAFALELLKNAYIESLTLTDIVPSFKFRELLEPMSKAKNLRTFGIEIFSDCENFRECFVLVSRIKQLTGFRPDIHAREEDFQMITDTLCELIKATALNELFIIVKCHVLSCYPNRCYLNLEQMKQICMALANNRNIHSIGILNNLPTEHYKLILEFIQNAAHITDISVIHNGATKNGHGTYFNANHTMPIETAIPDSDANKLMFAEIQAALEKNRQRLTQSATSLADLKKAQDQLSVNAKPAHPGSDNSPSKPAGYTRSSGQNLMLNSPASIKANSGHSGITTLSSSASVGMDMRDEEDVEMRDSNNAQNSLSLSHSQSRSNDTTENGVLASPNTNVNSSRSVLGKRKDNEAAKKEAQDDNTAEGNKAPAAKRSRPNG